MFILPIDKFKRLWYNKRLRVENRATMVAMSGFFNLSSIFTFCLQKIHICRFRLIFPKPSTPNPRPPSLICKFLILPAALERTSRFFHLLPAFRTFLPHNAPEARFAICPKLTSPAAHAHNPRNTKPKSHMLAFET